MEKLWMEIWAVAAAWDWNSITPANIITWVVMIGGWVAFWTKLKYRVDGHGEEFKQVQSRIDDLQDHVNGKFESQDRVLEEIKIQGSPASRQSAIVLNSRIDSQNQRLMRAEEAILEFKEIKVHVQWMREAMQKKE